MFTRKPGAVKDALSVLIPTIFHSFHMIKENSISGYILPVFFLFISFIYSSVGLGGGSSYTAILVILSINYTLIPATSLMLNLVVTFIGMVNFWRKVMDVSVLLHHF